MSFCRDGFSCANTSYKLIQATEEPILDGNRRTTLIRDPYFPILLTGHRAATPF